MPLLVKIISYSHQDLKINFSAAPSIDALCHDRRATSFCSLLEIRLDQIAPNFDHTFLIIELTLSTSRGFTPEPTSERVTAV